MFLAGSLLAGQATGAEAADVQPALERTCFQTSQRWSGAADLPGDVAIAYGIDPSLPQRMETWRQHGYIVHVMTGVSWGAYQDYLYGRFDGVNHEDEAQTDRQGNKISHGGDVYYMCPGTNYGKFLRRGIQRALEGGAEAIHLEEPEFWVRGGYSEGFKREWRQFYGEDWQPPHGSVTAQWRASKLKYFLYRRALQQVFDYVQDYNRQTGRHVRCYVPTHSLLNYAHWQIVSPESSLARLNGCDGYIAQVWTGTARTPNVYRGQLRERTFETAFLEYGAMQNLVRATGRRVWYLNDPVEDNPGHDWTDYRRNWESTLVASLFQPEVWRYEIAPWPERVFTGRYPRQATGDQRQSIPPAYATELQTVMNALNDLNQPRVEWDGGGATNSTNATGVSGLGVLISDSLMFERGEPSPSDAHMGHFYGLAMPLVKRGLPVAPVQLENLTVPRYLDGFRLLLLSYHGQKPLSPEPHGPLADWVKRGGALVVVDEDGDPFNRVPEWWNSNGKTYASPRQHLFEQLGLTDKAFGLETKPVKVGSGVVCWLHENPAALAADSEGDARLTKIVRETSAVAGLPSWREANYLLLRRGPYVVAAGLEESLAAAPKALSGHFVNLFDAELRVSTAVTLTPGSRFFLLDLDATPGAGPRMLAAACRTRPVKTDEKTLSLTVEGVADTPGMVLMRLAKAPQGVTLDGKPWEQFEYSAASHLLWIRFPNQADPRELSVKL
jgi:hypothetical protein